MNHQSRRKRFMESIADDVAIIPTAPPRQRNSDVEYRYRPDSDFYYLTHFAEPQAVAVFAPGSDEGDYILFCRNHDPKSERWDGHRAGLTGAVETFQADVAYSISEIDDRLPSLLRGRDQVHYCIGRYPEFDTAVINWLNEAKRGTRSGIRSPKKIVDIASTMHQMRLFKDKDEIEVMERAAKISAEAHKRAMRISRGGMNESEIQAEIEYWFQLNQCQYAYPSIVASGANACILHYVENSRQMQDGELLLIDAGAELDCYAADITRTFPIGNKFNPHQALIYEVVLEAQKKAIEMAVPGNRYDDVNDTATRVLTEGLIELGIIAGPVSEALESKTYREYYMHKIGHWLGLDVHDVGEYCDDAGNSRMLEPSMVMTIEPGLYLSASENLDEKWHDIGVRIEDDVLITGNGNRVLTEDVPKSISQIEQIKSQVNPVD